MSELLPAGRRRGVLSLSTLFLGGAIAAGCGGGGGGGGGGSTGGSVRAASPSPALPSQQSSSPSPAPQSAPSAPSPTATPNVAGHVSPTTEHDGEAQLREDAVRYHERVWLTQVGLPLPYRNGSTGLPTKVRTFGTDTPGQLPIGTAVPGAIAGTWSTTWDVDVASGIADECPGLIHEWYHVALFAAGVAGGDAGHTDPRWAEIDALAAHASHRIAFARGVTNYQWPSSRASCAGEHDHGHLPGYVGH